MRRIASISLLFGFLVLGTGLFEHLHNREHAREDARLLAMADSDAAHKPKAPVHNDSNCEVHAQLHMPTIAGGWVPLLISLGIFVAFLTELAPRLTPQRTFTRVDCRGPPTC